MLILEAILGLRCIFNDSSNFCAVGSYFLISVRSKACHCCRRIVSHIINVRVHVYFDVLYQSSDESDLPVRVTITSLTQGNFGHGLRIE